MKLYNLESGVFYVQVRCISNELWTQITPVLICSAGLCVKVLEKITARTLCFMHQGIFRPNCIFNNKVSRYTYITPTVYIPHLSNKRC